MDTSFKNCYCSVHKGCNYVRNNWIKNSVPHVHPHTHTHTHTHTHIYIYREREREREKENLQNFRSIR